MSRALGLLLGLVVAFGCRISNDDHCVHKAIDSDHWCAENVPDRPFCSPCEAEQHGCVAARPDEDECPAYTPDDASSSGSDGSSGDAG